MRSKAFPWILPSAVKIGFVISASAAITACSPPPGPPSLPSLQDAGGKGVVDVSVSDGVGSDTKHAAGPANLAAPNVTATATKTGTAKGVVSTWRTVRGTLNVQRAQGANGTATGLSDNTATTTLTMKGTADRPSTAVGAMNISAHLHDADPAGVKVVVTFTVAAGGTTYNTPTSVTYAITEDKNDVNKVFITDGTKTEHPGQGQAVKFTWTGNAFSLPHAASGTATFNSTYHVVVTAKTESVAEVDADGEIKIN